jgi:hypothetical protein
MEILKSKIRFWSLPKLMLITTLLSLINIVIIFDASRSHSDIAHLVGLLWARDRPTVKTSKRTTHITHNRQTSMLLAVFEPPIPASERQTNPRLRLRGHRVWEILYIRSLFYLPPVICHFASSFAALTQPTRPTAYRQSRGAVRCDNEYLSDKIMSRVFGV